MMYDITQKEEKNEKTIEYEFHEYNPITGANLNQGGEIRIVVQNQDLFLHPSESYLIIDGELVKADNTRYAVGDRISLVNNALLHLFSSASYRLSGKEIDRVYNPGHATTMTGILKYGESSMINLWEKDTDAGTTDVANTGFEKRKQILLNAPDPIGSFSFKIPLKHIFGFCEDYEKVVYGFEHQLTLQRGGHDHDAIYRHGTVDGKVVIHKISWFIPHVTPSDSEKLSLYKTIQSKSKLPVSFRKISCDTIVVPQTMNFSWTLSSQSSPDSPRYVIVGFQTGKNSIQTANSGLFNHCNCTDMYVMLNSDKYPRANHFIDFGKMRFARLFEDASTFREKYYGIEKVEKEFDITPTEFKNLYPLFVFDVSKRSERMKLTTSDIKVSATFSAAIPANTHAYAVVISDRSVQFQSDGNKMSVEY